MIAIFSMALICSIVLVFLNIRKFMHIFQQSFYQLKEFIPALNTTKVYKINVLEIILFLLAALSLFNNALLIPYIIFNLIAIYVLSITKTKDKKKFVYTTRVKITLSITAILILLLIGLAIKSYKFKYINIIFVILSMYKFVSILFVLLGNLLAQPILYLINHKYIGEAKKIIKSNKNLKVIAVTGSYGKTSTKNIITSLINEKFITVMTPKSYNTTLGVVKVIREEIKPYTEVFVCEMGASKKKDIEKICKIAKPDISVITSIGPQHLTTFKTMKNIVKTKFEIIRNAKENAIAVLNLDNQYIKNEIETNKISNEILTYSFEDENVNYTASNIKMSEEGSTFIINYNDNKIHIKTKLLGKYNIYNILCAVAIAKKMGITDEEIEKYIQKIKPVEHRLELKELGGIPALDDSFNSNPEGSKMAIEVLSMFENKYKVLVTSGMIGLGQKQDELNRKFGKYASILDYVILVGKATTNMVEEGLKEMDFENYIVVDTLDEAFKLLWKMKSERENLLALFENDLPDSYIK